VVVVVLADCQLIIILQYTQLVVVVVVVAWPTLLISLLLPVKF
jgi:hypothetical protein